MIVYLARDIPAFVMYCVYGASRSSLLIESTNSMIMVHYYYCLQTQDDAPRQTVAADTALTNEVCVVCIHNYLI